MYKEILSDHCPFVNYEWRGVCGSSPRKTLMSMKQNRVIFINFGTKHSLLKESIDSLFL